MTITVIDNLAALEQYSGFADQEFVYVKGYSLPGDGGEGFFRYAPGFTTTYNGMYIAPVAGGVTGRWVREDYQFLNVKFFGAKGNGDDEDTSAVQDAIDFAADHENRTIYFPNGTYLCDTLVLKNKVKLSGELANTIIEAKVGSATAKGLFEIDDGPVTGVIMENFVLDGATKTIRGFYFVARKGSDVHGGLWNSRFSNITFINFDSHGIHMVGSNDYDDKAPNQFLSFENVRVNRTVMNGVHGLFIEGQAGQMNFLNCTFDGELTKMNPPATGTNIYLKSRSVGEGIPAVIMFDTCTSQNATGAILLEGCQNIQIINCWFENLDGAIFVKGRDVPPPIDFARSRVINIEGCRFANANDFGTSGNGYILKAQDQSYIVFNKNVVVPSNTPAEAYDIQFGSTVIKENNYPTGLN